MTLQVHIKNVSVNYKSILFIKVPEIIGSYTCSLEQVPIYFMNIMIPRIKHDFFQLSACVTASTLKSSVDVYQFKYLYSVLNVNV